MEEKINKLKNEIVICEKEYLSLLEDSQSIKEKCVGEIISFVQAEYKNEVEKSVKTKVDITNSLGIEKLKILKGKMNKIIDNVKNGKETITNNQDIWISNEEFFSGICFNKGDTFGIEYNNENGIHESIKNLIIILNSDVWEILNECGYVDINGNFERKNGRLTYKWVTLSKELGVVIKEYQSIFKSAFECKVKLYRLNKELAETKALFLWEQA